MIKKVIAVTVAAVLAAPVLPERVCAEDTPFDAAEISVQEETAPILSWGVGKEGSLDGWNVNDAQAVFEEDGSCLLNITGPDTSVSEDNLQIDTTVYRTMELTYINDTDCTAGEAYFINDSQTVEGFQPGCTVAFSVEKGEHTAVIPFSDNINWTGTVNALRIDPVKDLTSGTFRIISMEMTSEKAPELELTSEWEWDTDGDFEQWTFNDIIVDPQVSGGYLILPVEGEDANMNSPLMSLDTVLYPTVEIVYKNETDNQDAELFWNNGGGINQACSTAFTALNDGEWHTLRINLSQNSNWTGKVTGIRLDPIRMGSGIFTIDSLRFLKTTDTQGQLAEEWEWRTAQDLDGWSPLNTSVSVENGRVIMDLDGSADPGLQNESDLEINADEFRTLEITYKNSANRSDAQFYWGDADGNWVAADGVHVQDFTAVNDGQWHTLRVSLQDNPMWNGTVTKLRIDPTQDGGTGTFEIDRLALLYDGVPETSARYEMSNGYFSISGVKGTLDKIAFDPTGQGNYSEDLISGYLFMKMDVNDVPYDVLSEEAVGTISGNTLTISGIRFGDPEMIGTWSITLEGNKMSNTFSLDPQGNGAVLKNAGFSMDILWENNTDEVEGEQNAPGSLKVPFVKMVSASDRYHSVYAFKYMPEQEDVSTLGLEGEWIDWEGTNGFPFNLRFEPDTEFVSPVCSIDNLCYLFRNPDADETELTGEQIFERTLDITVSESSDITPEHFARYEMGGDNGDTFADALNDMMYEFGYAREPASTQPDWWEWISLTRAWRNDHYLQADLDKVTGVQQISEETYEEGDPGIGYIYTWNSLKGWPFPENRDSNHYLMSTANYINAVYNYYMYNGNKDFLNNNIDKMRLGMEYLLTMYDEESDLFLINHPDHNGVADLSDNTGSNTDPSRMSDSVGSNYWDITPYGYMSAYDNLYCYMALNRMAEIEELMEQPERSEELREYASDLKEGYNKAFWTGNHYIQTIDAEGKEHDYGSVYLNLEAINYGMASAEQAEKMMEYMDTTVTDSGSADTFSRYAFAPRVTMKDNQYWYVYLYGEPGAYGDKQLQNGGADFYTMYYELMSWIKTGNTDRAYERLQSLVNAFNEDQHLQGNNIMNDGSKNQHFGEGSVGIWGEFPESGLVPVAVKDGFMGISADKDGLKISPNLPGSIPEISLDGIDYWGLGLKVTVSDTLVTIEARENTGDYNWAVNGERVTGDENGLFTASVDINKGDTVTLSIASEAGSDDQKPNDQQQGDQNPDGQQQGEQNPDGQQQGDQNPDDQQNGQAGSENDGASGSGGTEASSTQSIQTGDDTNVMLWIVIAMVSILCVSGGIVLVWKKHRFRR